jgi:hypothetical protein
MEWNEEVGILKRDPGGKRPSNPPFGGGAILGMKGIGGKTAT